MTIIGILPAIKPVDCGSPAEVHASAPSAALFLAGRLVRRPGALETVSRILCVCGMRNATSDPPALPIPAARSAVDRGSAKCAIRWGEERDTFSRGPAVSTRRDDRDVDPLFAGCPGHRLWRRLEIACGGLMRLKTWIVAALGLGSFVLLIAQSMLASHRERKTSTPTRRAEHPPSPSRAVCRQLGAALRR
jgi:hypothetical protein